MSRRYRAVVAAVAISTLVAGSAHAKGGKLAVTSDIGDGDQRLALDPPISHLTATEYGVRADTLWFGGQGGDGLTIEGGVWDFETGEQGWSSIDLTDVPVSFRHVTADSAVAHGDPVDPTMTDDGSTGSMWVGFHEDEAQALCWPGGQGYGNGWIQDLSKGFTYGGTDEVTISFDYFVDSETEFDFCYVIVVNEDGTESDPLNFNQFPTEDGWGYSGSVPEGTGVGSPSSPEADVITVDVLNLPDGAGDPFEVVFRFESDPLFSDQLDSSGGFLNTAAGAWGFDDVQVAGTALSDFSDFEPTGTPGEEYDGWTPSAEPGIGELFKIANLSELDPIADACDCDVVGNVMVAAIIDGSDFPHPKRQFERLESNPTYVGPGSAGEGRNGRVIQWDVWADLPQSNAVYYREMLHYYPWTCPQTGTVGWTLLPAGDRSFTWADPARCRTFVSDISGFLPAAGVDSIKVVFDLTSDCDDFGTEDCTGPEQTNHSPYFDNVRLGLVGQDVDAPTLALDLRYQDCFPAQNSLLPNAVAEMYSDYDNNRSDDNPTNAFMGDSVTVNAGNDPDTEVYLNFRVYPGPAMDTGDAWFTKFGSSSIAPSWAKARMDTAQTQSGLNQGLYMTFLHEDDPAFSAPEAVGTTLNEENEILPDMFFSPGTTIEYFFSTNYTGNPDQATLPDTTGEFYLEVEVLPGYFETASGVMTPCVLYVDAFNFGAQVPIEERGLDPTFGSVTDESGLDHNGWDRYDYLLASTNVPAPLARESSGNNGMTKYQSMIYQTILYNTGSFSNEGLRDGDADLLANWLTSDDFDRWTLQKGLWLSGNGMPTILDNDTRPVNQNLLANFVGATVDCSGDAYFTPGCAGAEGDSTLCVRLDPSVARDFPATGDSYGSVRGNGCPDLLQFRVVNELGDGTGNLEYVNQDAGGAITQYASISNDQFAPTNPANYAVVMDAFSVHYLRSTPDGWTGEDCGDDSSAIGRRISDVLDFLGAPTGVCDPEEIVVGVGDGPSGVPGARTVLFQNTPNPFNPRTTVRYQLGEAAHVKLRIYDVAGRLVRTLVDAPQVAESYEVVWDGQSDLGEVASSGVYWARMSTSAGFSASTKMVVLK